MTITFRVYGEPKGQPRPRAFALNGKARMYDPGTAEGWKSCIAAAMRPHVGNPIFSGPLMLDITFHMPRPRGHYRTGKRSSELREDAPTWHTGKPDADNMAKAVMDAITMLGVWPDDAIVAELCVRKHYSSQPGADVTIRSLTRM